MRCFMEPPKKPMDKDIFVDNINYLVQNTYPNNEDQHPLFKKFGTRTGGLCDTWSYAIDWKENTTEVEKWKFVALCSLYWYKQYEYWLERKEYDEYKDFLKQSHEQHPTVGWDRTLKRLQDME